MVKPKIATTGNCCYRTRMSLSASFMVHVLIFDVQMEEGNEGDVIIFLALRQIECNIPSEIRSIGQLTPDLLIEVVDRCLFLISDGTIKVCCR